MSLRFLLSLLLVSFFWNRVSAQNPNDYKQPRILILLDGSSSMVQNWANDQTRFQVAGKVILNLMDSIYRINPNVEFSLRVYGHQHGVPDNNCFDTRREVMFSRNNLTQMAFRLESLKPIGVSPIAFSLKEAAENDFVNEREYAYSLVLITDGGESCGGDICAVVRDLLARKIEFKPYIISLLDYALLRDQYNCLGTYLQITKPEDMGLAVGTIASSYRKNLAVPILKGKEEPVKTARTPIPSALNISVPIASVPAKDTIVLPRQAPQPAADKTWVLTPEILPAIASSRMYRMVRNKPVINTRNKLPIPLIVYPPKEEEPVVMIQETIATLSVPARYHLVQPQRNVVLRKPVAVPAISFPPREEEPVVLAKEELVALRSRKIRLFTTGQFQPSPARRQSLPTIYFPPKEEDPIILPKEEIVALRRKTRLNLQQYFYAIPKKPRLAIPTIIYPKKEEEPVVTTAPPRPAPKPVTTPPAKPQEDIVEAQFTTESQPSAKTTLQVYFKSANGKYFQTTPRIILIDQKTKQEVKRFFRTVDGSGNPDLQEVPPGTYTVTFEANRSLVARNVVIKESENQRVTIIITNGTLRFEYEPNLKRPINEFTATVKRNFEYAPTVEQSCAEAKSYEPGNYHIEINTLPPDKRNIDLDFAATYYIRINEPGWVQFTNQNKVGKVILYYPLGDQYARFYSMDVLGNKDAQKLRLQPGTFRAVYLDATGREMIKSFRVKSNEVTDLEL